MAMMRVKDIIFDESLYPRDEVNSQHVTTLMDAIVTGSKMPPIIIEQKNRIVDGVHRWRAVWRLYGPEGKIEVVQVAYKNEAEVLLAATELNERHGLRLEVNECTAVAIRLRNLKVSTARIAIALHTTADKVEHILLVKTATSRQSGTLIALKRSMSPLAGTKLTTLEEIANRSAPGIPWAFHIEQLNKALRAGLGVKWGLEAKGHLIETLELLQAVESELAA